MKYWSELPHKSIDDTLPSLKHLSAPGPRNYFVFDHLDTVIGVGGIHVGNEIGFLLHQDYWGKGFAKEAIDAIIEHVWTETEHDSITADVDPRNLASVKLLTKIGFQVNGFAKNTFCVGGLWSDSVYFCLQKPSAKL